MQGIGRNLPLSKDKCIEVLGDWEGYTVGTVGRFESDEEGCPGRVEIELLGIAGRRMVCSGCGEEVESDELQIVKILRQNESEEKKRTPLRGRGYRECGFMKKDM